MLIVDLIIYLCYNYRNTIMFCILSLYPATFLNSCLNSNRWTIAFSDFLKTYTIMLLNITNHQRNANQNHNEISPPVWRLLKKLKIELLCNPTVLLLSIHPNEMKSGCERDICIPMFIAALFTITIARMWKQPKCP